MEGYWNSPSEFVLHSIVSFQDVPALVFVEVAWCALYLVSLSLQKQLFSFQQLHLPKTTFIFRKHFINLYSTRCTNKLSKTLRSNAFRSNSRKNITTIGELIIHETMYNTNIKMVFTLLSNWFQETWLSNHLLPEGKFWNRWSKQTLTTKLAILENLGKFRGKCSWKWLGDNSSQATIRPKFQKATIRPKRQFVPFWKGDNSSHFEKATIRPKLFNWSANYQPFEGWNERNQTNYKWILSTTRQ